MTNGEKIKEIFPNVEISPNPYSPSVDIHIGGIMMMRVDRNWWYAEYKEPTTKNDLEVDCISRQAVEDAMYDATRAMDLNYGQIMEYIDNLPPVTPIRPKGHWIDKQHSFETCSAECSSCHERSNGYVFDNGFSLECEYYDYCPKCGADMREVEE